MECKKYGCISSKNMIVDYSNEDGDIFQAWYLSDQVKDSDKDMVVVYDHTVGDWPPLGISTVSFQEFIDDHTWTEGEIRTMDDDSKEKEAAVKKYLEQNPGKEYIDDDWDEYDNEDE